MAKPRVRLNPGHTWAGETGTADHVEEGLSNRLMIIILLDNGMKSCVFSHTEFTLLNPEEADFHELTLENPTEI